MASVFNFKVPNFPSFPGAGKKEKRVLLGDTGLSIYPLGIGTWAWGNKLLWVCAAVAVIPLTPNRYQSLPVCAVSQRCTPCDPSSCRHPLRP